MATQAAGVIGQPAAVRPSGMRWLGIGALVIVIALVGGTIGWLLAGGVGRMSDDVTTVRGARRPVRGARRPAPRRQLSCRPCRDGFTRKAASFTESVIREMNRLAVEAGAVSLAQGFPDFEARGELRGAAVEALHADVNQYAITWGAKPLREAIAAKTARFHPGWIVDPETAVTVTCGATEAMIAAMLGILDPGDEVVVFEPFYENYGPDAILAGATAALRDPPRAGLVDRPRRAPGGVHDRGPGRSS